MQLVAVETLQPAAYNPRAVDPARLDLVELSLRKLGFLLPIYADARGELLSGHQRMHVAAERIGLTRLPVERVPEMSLAERKSLNIAFNRGTNDLRPWDTPADLSKAVARQQVHELAARLPDLDPADDQSFFPCLAAAPVPVRDLCAANRGRWIDYARNVARMLAGKGLSQPIVATRELWVVNGIGRLQHLAESGVETAQVVFISDEQAEFAAAMLNLLSMDFDLHRKYADVLRYNSFRRPRGRRTCLGRAFTFALLGRKSSNTFDVREPCSLTRWREKYGDPVLDFGAGLLDETRLLRAAGIDCTPFEPFLLKKGTQEIDPAGARRLTRAFLAEVASGKRWRSVFLSAVLNSVPFLEDRKHIVTLLAELCWPDATLYAVSASTTQAGYKLVSGKAFANQNDGQRLQFALNYEPRITLADFGATPKVQKYHTREEFGELFAGRFGSVATSESSNNVEAVCSRPRRPDWGDLAAAAAFEFDLPYPDGSRLGLADAAISAFQSRRRRQ